MRKKYSPEHVMIRDAVCYYVRHIPCDLIAYYNVSRLRFSLKTKSLKAAIRTSKSVTQRIEDYWLGLRLQNMDIPAIRVAKSRDTHESDNLLYLKPASHTFGKKEDVFLYTDIPFEQPCERPRRPLKTRSGERDLPLVGATLWAAH